MNVSYDYYKIFYCVAKHKSFTRAAEELFAGQPNVTRTVKLLEEQLGCQLLSRSKRRVELTPEGEKLFGHLQTAFEHVRMGEEELLADKSLQGGMVSVGVSETALYGLLLSVLKQFRARYRGIKLKIGNYSTKQAISALSDGLVDFSVVTTPLAELPSEWSVKELVRFRELAVCGRDFAGLAEREVSFRELSQYPLVGLGRSTKTFDFYTELFSASGVGYNPEIEVATADQLLPMIRSNLGIGFVPEFFVKGAKGIYEIKTAEEIPARAICLVKRDRPLSLAAKRLEEEILA